MATALVFANEAVNCMRLVQILRGPGCTALQNVLVRYSTQRYTQPSFDKVLLDPGVKATLKNLHQRGRILTKGQWLTLYGRHFPQDNIHKLGKPETFDITLTFLLVRNLCGLAPPKVPPGSPPGTTPSWDTEPTPTDTSLEANLARIKFYRNYLCHHETGEIPDHEFNAIFDTLKQSMVDISTTLNLPPPQWSVTPADLERFRTDPISQDDAEEIENLRKDWGQQERDILDKLNSLKDDHKQHCDAQMGQLTTIKDVQKQHHDTHIEHLKTMKDIQKQQHDTQMEQHGIEIGQLKAIQQNTAHGEAVYKEQLKQSKNIHEMGEKVKSIEKQLDKMTDIDPQPTTETETTPKGQKIKTKKFLGLLPVPKFIQTKMDMKKLKKALCIYFKIHFNHLQRNPADENDTMILKDTYVNLSWNQSVLTNTKKVIQALEHYSQIFVIAGKGSHVLVEGEPGMGKTTFVKKVTIDWVETIENIQRNIVKELKQFSILFVITLRFVQKDDSLVSIIIDQHGLEVEKENLEKILKSHDSILLILDGYDEYTVGTCSQIDAIIERKLYKNLTVLMTSRPWKSTPFATTKRFFSHHFQIEGFRAIEEIEEFVQRYFQDVSKTKSFAAAIKASKLVSLSKVPIMLLILCLLFEEEGQSLPSDQHVLYWKLMNWFYMRYTAKGGQCDMTLEEILLKLGELALQGLLKGQLLFERKEIEKELGSKVFEMGFLTSEKIRGSTAANISVSFPHKSIQDYVAGYYLANSDDGWVILNNIPQSELVKHFWSDTNALKFAVKISENVLANVLGLFDPLHDKGIFQFVTDYKSEELLPSGHLTTDMSPELYGHYRMLTYLQSDLSSHFNQDPVVINTRNLDSTDVVSSSKVLSSGSLTSTDIVDKSETVISCFKVDRDYRYSYAKDALFAFIFFTNFKVISVSCFDLDEVEEDRKLEILRCLVGCGLEDLSVLGLSRCNYSIPEIREICQKSKNLRILDLSDCEITKDLTSDVCEVVVKQSHLIQLNLSGNKDVDWKYLLTHYLSSNLRTLRALRLRGCNIPESVLLILVEFIKAQRDLVSLDLSYNDDLENILSQLVEMVPDTPSQIFNLVSLGLGPISSGQSETLKSVIIQSKNLRELTLWLCQCDVSKEITDKQNLEILDISDNDAWVISGNKDIPLDVGYILRHIDKLSNLRRIIAQRCCIGDDVMDHLIQNLYKNPNLTWIDFKDNSISEDKVNILRSTCGWVDFWGDDGDDDAFYLKHYGI